MTIPSNFASHKRGHAECAYSKCNKIIKINSTTHKCCCVFHRKQHIAEVNEANERYRMSKKHMKFDPETCPLSKLARY